MYCANSSGTYESLTSSWTNSYFLNSRYAGDASYNAMWYMSLENNEYYLRIRYGLRMYVYKIPNDLTY